MIKELTLENFKTHKDTRLVFSPHINVIVGKSDHGKSNIIRALNWVVTNRPLGENVIRWGQEETLVQLIIEDNKKQIGITRSKKKNHNKYIISTSDSEEDISFTSFGSNPPQPVLDVLNLSDINIQKQSKQYFLIFDSPGQVATYIRSITKLDKVDNVVKLLASKIRIEKGDITNCQNNLEVIKQELDELAKIDLNGLEDKIDKTKSLIEKNKNLLKEQQELSKLLYDLEEIERSIIYLPDNIDEILQKGDQVSKSYLEISDEKSNLTILLDELELIERQKIVLPKNVEVLSKIEETIQQYSNTCKMVDKLLNLLDDIVDVDEEIFNASHKIKSLLVEEKQLMSQLNNCPYCGSELSDKSKSCLLNNNN